MKQRLVVSVDLGGTNIRLGLVDSKGAVVRRRRVKMFEVRSRQKLLEALAEVVVSFVKANTDLPSPVAAGIGFAGPTRAGRGYVYFAPNIARLSDIEVGSYLEDRLDMPAVVQNDANCAALGEYWCGAGRGTSSLFVFTLGTGVGGSLVIDGNLWEGHDGIAGEVGHTVIDMKGPRCECGNKGCLETFVSATAIVKAYGKYMPVRPKPKGPGVTARAIVDRAKEGDGIARTVLLRAADALGVGIANVFHLFNPELILIGGGVSRAGSILIDPAVRRARDAIFPPLRARLKVKRTRLGDAAALIGAAYLAHGVTRGVRS